MSDQDKKVNKDELSQVKSLIGDASGKDFKLDDILAEFGTKPPRPRAVPAEPTLQGPDLPWPEAPRRPRPEGKVVAFPGTPRHPEVSLKDIICQPVETWKDSMKNDFEDSVFLKYPEIAAIKDELYDLGAVYASMSGSGSSVYGIFRQPVEHVDEKFGGCFCRQRELD